jgi:hypothetical protein
VFVTFVFSVHSENCHSISASDLSTTNPPTHESKALLITWPTRILVYGVCVCVRF